MKFRISTALLVIAILFVSLGWFIDHRHEEIVGSWHYPTPDINVGGYRTTLDIRKDGTFEKVQQYALGYQRVYKGSYSVKENREFVFSVSEEIFKFPGKEPISESFDDSFRCRCAVDKSGYLLFHVLSSSFAETNKIKWENYVRDEERTFRKEEFLQEAGTR